MIRILGIFSFLKFSVADAFDILMVATIIYVVIRWLKDSSARNIVLAVLFLLVVEMIVDALDMRMTSAILHTIFDVGVIAMIIIFQPEIRHFLNRLGRNAGFTRRSNAFINKIFGIKEDKLDTSSVNELAEACRTMSAEHTGALIVMPRLDSLEYIVETGDKVDALVSRRVIMNLFFKNSPLHDGAMIISGNRIVAARCTLPITSRTDIPASYGMRHRAAIGITEESDADVIVVSEETGKIGFVHGGTLTPINNLNELKLKLGASLDGQDAGTAEKAGTDN